MCVSHVEITLYTYNEWVKRGQNKKETISYRKIHVELQ